MYVCLFVQVMTLCGDLAKLATNVQVSIMLQSRMRQSSVAVRSPVVTIESPMRSQYIQKWVKIHVLKFPQF